MHSFHLLRFAFEGCEIRETLPRQAEDGHDTTLTIGCLLGIYICVCVSTAGGGKAREAEARETDQVRRLRCAACRQLGNNRHDLNLFFPFLSLFLSLYLCISVSLFL
jgi:hypothetical protein